MPVISWRFLYWLPAFVVATVIFTLSSMPDFGALEHPFLHESDKTIHAFVYGLLAVSILWALEGGFGAVPAVRNLWVAAAAAAVYGITDEFHQWFVPGRMATWQDWAADAVGSMLGVYLIWFLLRFRMRRDGSSAGSSPGQSRKS
jgi:VanZ family protein